MVTLAKNLSKAIGYPLAYHYQTLSKNDRIFSLAQHFKLKAKAIEQKKECDIYDNNFTRQWEQKTKYWLKQIKYQKKVMKYLDNYGGDI